MAVYLPQLFEDEALFSAIARYGEGMIVAIWPVFLEGLFGYRPRLSPALFQNLERIALQTDICWGRSAQELATRATLLPYLLSFLDRQPAEIIKRAVSGDVNIARLTNLYLRSWHKTLRACPVCVAGDCKAGWPPYWRRAHQLPCVLVCDIHNAILKEYSYRQTWNTQWPALEAALEEAALPPILPYVFPPIWRAVAKISREVLECGHQGAGEALVPNAASVIRSRFSLTTAGGRADLRWSFSRAFGEDVLAGLGLVLTGKRDWLCGRLGGRFAVMASVVDVLIAAYGRSLQPHDLRQEWPRCVNALAIHGPDYPVGWLNAVAGRVRAACTCGATFSFPVNT